MTKPNKINLKNLLVTASTLAISLASSNAFADDLDTANGDSETVNAAHWNPAQTPADGDNLTLQGAHNIILNSAADRDFGWLYLNEFDGQTLTVSNANAYSFTETTVFNDETINVTYGAAGSLIIGNTHNALGDVDFANNAGTLIITDGDVGGVDSVGGVNGTLVINGTTTAALIGGTKSLTAVNIGAAGALTAGADIKATTLKFLADGGKVDLADQTFTGAVDFNNTAGTLILADGGQVTGAVDGDVSNTGTNGTIAVVGDDGVLKTATITGIIGGTKAVERIKLGVEAGNIANSKDYAKLITQDDVTVENIDFGGVNSVLQIDGANQLNVITGTTGKGNIIVNGAGTLKGLLGGTADANVLTSIKFLNAAATLDTATIFTDKIDGAGGNTTITVVGSSSITLKGANKASDNEALYKINDNQTLTLGGGIFAGTINAQNAGTGSKLKIDANANTVELNGIVGGGNAIGDIEVNSGTLVAGANITLSNAGASDGKLKFTGAGIANLGARTLTGAVDFNNTAGTLILADGGQVTGAVDGDVSNTGTNGTIAVVGDDGVLKTATITGIIGGTKAVERIKLGVEAGNIANSKDYAKLITQDDVTVENIDFGGVNSVLQIDGANQLNVITGTTGKGNIIVNGAGTLKKAFLGGTADANVLTSIKFLNAAATLDTATIFTDKIDGAGGNTTITVVGSSSITLKGANKASDNEALYKINDNQTLTLGGGIFAGTINAQNAGTGSKLKIDANANTVELNGIVGGGNAIGDIEVNSGTLVAGANITLSNAGASDGKLKFTGAGIANLGARTLTGAVDFNNTAGTLILADGGQVTGAVDGDVSNTGTNGTIAVVGDDGVLKTATITGIIGGTKAVERIKLGVEAGNIANSKDYAKLITQDDVTVENIDFGGVNSVLQIDGANQLNVITGTTGKGNIIVNGAGTLKGLLGGTADANVLTSIKFLNAAATLDTATIFTDKIDGAGGNTTITVVGSSSITLKGANKASDNEALYKINDNQTLTLGGGIFAGTINAQNAGTGSKLKIDANANTVELNGIVGGGNAIGDIEVNSGTLVAGANITLSNAGASDGKLKFTGAGIANLGARTLTGAVDFNNTAGTLILADGGQVTGAVDGDVSNTGTNGTIAVVGDDGVLKTATITGIIGGTKAVERIKLGVEAGNIANSKDYAKLITQDDVTVENIDFGGVNSVLQIDGANQLNVITGTTGKGNIIVNGAGTLKGLLGGTADANVLTSIKFLNAAATLDTATIFTDKIDGAGGNTTITVVGSSSITLKGANKASDNEALYKINDNQTLTLGGGIFAGTINAQNAGTGSKLKIDANANTVELNGIVGGGNAIGDIEVNSGTLVAGANITLSNAGASDGKLKFTGAGIANLGARTLTGNVDFNGQNGTVIVANGGNITGTITTTVNNTGTLKWKGGDLAQNIGATGFSLLALEVAETNDVASDAHNIYAQTVTVKANTFTLATPDMLEADTVTIDNGATFTNNSVNLNAEVTGLGTLTLGAMPTGAKFKINGIDTVNLNGVDLNKEFKAGTANIKGNVNIVAGGDATFTKTVKIDGGTTFAHKAGKLTVGQYISGAGTFSHELAGALPTIGAAGNTLTILNLIGPDATKHSVSGDVYATTTNVAAKQELQLTGASSFKGDVNLADASVLTLGVNTLNSTGEVAATGAGVVINSTLNSADAYGKISAAKTKLAGKNVTVNFDGSFTLKDGTVLQLVSNLDGKPTNLIIKEASTLNKITMQDDGSLLFAFDKAGAAKVATDIAEIIGTEAGSAEVKALIENIEDTTGEANVFATQLAALDFTDPAQASLAKEASVRAYSNTTTAVAEVNSANISEGLAIISGVASSGFMAATAADSADSAGARSVKGVSSGDEDGLYRNGLWAQGFGSQGIQKLAKGRAGYKSTSMGGVIGADTLANDYLRVGIAGIHADSNVKMRDQKRGDKISAKSWMMSIYGVYEINPNLYTRAIATFGNTNVTTRENKPVPVVGAAGTMSTGKYTSQSYSIDVAAGYRHNLAENLAIIPEVGLRANVFNDGGYTETGGSTNRTVTKRKGTNYLAIAGATVSSNLMLGEAEFSPSIHARVMQDIGGKNPEVSSKMNGSFITQTTKSKAISKTSFQAGADLTARYGMMEYGIGYDANISKKFLSHSGSMKLRVSF